MVRRVFTHPAQSCSRSASYRNTRHLVPRRCRTVLFNAIKSPTKHCGRRLTLYCVSQRSERSQRSIPTVDRKTMCLSSHLYSSRNTSYLLSVLDEFVADKRGTVTSTVTSRIEPCEVFQRDVFLQLREKTQGRDWDDAVTIKSLTCATTKSFSSTETALSENNLVKPMTHITSTACSCQYCGAPHTRISNSIQCIRRKSRVEERCRSV